MGCYWKEGMKEGEKCTTILTRRCVMMDGNRRRATSKLHTSLVFIYHTPPDVYAAAAPLCERHGERCELREGKGRLLTQRFKRKKERRGTGKMMREEEEK